MRLRSMSCEKEGTANLFWKQLTLETWASPYYLVWWEIASWPLASISIDVSVFWKRLTSQTQTHTNTNTHPLFTWYRPLCCLALWSGLPWDRCCVRMTQSSGWEVGSCPGKLSCGRGWICSPHLTAGTSGNHPWSWRCPSWLPGKQRENPTLKMWLHQVVPPPSPLCLCSPGDPRGKMCSPDIQ